jgi:hypothetical protein
MPPDRRPLVYVDENVSHRLVDALRERGFDVLTAAQAGTLGQTDEQQLAYAALQRRAIVTYDRRDFRTIHGRFVASADHAGIALLPQSGPVARTVIRAAMLLDWIASAPTPSPIANWNDLQRRIHEGLRPAGYSSEEILMALGEVRPA